MDKLIIMENVSKSNRHLTPIFTASFTILLSEIKYINIKEKIYYDKSHG